MMEKPLLFISWKTIVMLLVLTFGTNTFSQQADPKGWQFGGGLGLSIGSGYTDIMIAPGAIYNFNRYVAAGVGLQGSYVYSKDYYESYIYGGSLIGLFQPIPQVQLSVELEQLRVNTTYDTTYWYYYNDGPYSAQADRTENFWNTALYLGAGYRVQNVTIGVRYNVLFDDDESGYSDGFMPFVRVYF
jgi:hypothetical protein